MQTRLQNLGRGAQYQDFIEDQTICPLCSGSLSIKTQAMEQSQKIKEKAHCPDCEVTVRSKVHIFH